MIPTESKTAIIVPVHKKSDSKKWEDYRGLSLLNIAFKICESFVIAHFGPAYVEQVGENQSGVKLMCGCRDQIFTLRQILEQRCQYHRPTVMTFIDFMVAFDSADHCTIRNRCSTLGLGQVMVSFSKVLYDEIYCSMRANNTLSTPFQVTTGVTQGSKPSPLLFVIVIDWVLTEATPDRIFGNQLDDMTISKLDFADDICYFEVDFKAAQEILSSVIAAAAETGLVIITKKRKQCSQTTPPKT